MGVEPTTPGLQNQCSAIELLGHKYRFPPTTVPEWLHVSSMNLVSWTTRKADSPHSLPRLTGADDGTRTRNSQFGKLELYH